MNNGVILTAVLSFVGTLIGTFGGIMKSNELTNYKIEETKEDIKELQKRVDKHNHLMGRMVAVEKSAASAHKRIDELRA